MTVLPASIEQIIKLWHSPDLALIGQRCERRMRMFASLGMTVNAEGVATQAQQFFTR